MPEHDLRLVVSLGNPGMAYQQTRHNAGFLALDVIADTHGFPGGPYHWAGMSGCAGAVSVPLTS